MSVAIPSCRLARSSRTPLSASAAPASNLPFVKSQRPSPLVAAERPQMTDEERAAGLKALAERVLDPNWLNRDVLENIEQLTERDHQ
jgi:hypothetical protein